MTTSNCPDDERIRQALEGGSQDEEFFGHLEGCAKCRARVERRFDDEVLVGAFGFGGNTHGGAPESVEDPRELAGFEIVREIRRGGQGVVYEARDPGTGRRVALKTIHHSAQASQQKRARFEREITLTAGLDHAGIVRLYQSGQTADGTQYFAMEYVEGQDLTDLLRREGPVATDMEAKQRLRLFIKVCDAIAHAHSRGVMHRDLKPSNIRVDLAGEPHVLDFGLAKQLDADVSDELTRSIEFVGTMVWAAPEQTPLVKASVGPWTDVYTLGHLLHHLFTRKHPHSTDGGILEVLARIAYSRPELPGKSLVGLSISRDLDAIVRRALEKEPQDRYTSVVEMAEDCRALLEGRPVSARDSGTFVLAAKLVRRHPMWTAVGAIALAGIIFVGRSLRSEVHALERAAAMLNLENISRVGGLRSAAKSHEEAAWRLLLTGGSALDSQLPDLANFPGTAGMLDKMRGAYVTMPVTGTYRGGEQFVSGVPGRAECVVFESQERGTRLIVTQLPTLQSSEFDLLLDNVVRCRFSPVADEIYFLSDDEVYVQSYPIKRGEQPVPVAEWGSAPAWISSASDARTSGYSTVFIPASFAASGGMDAAADFGVATMTLLKIYSSESFSTGEPGGEKTIQALTSDGWVGMGEYPSRLRSLRYWDGGELPVVASQEYANFPRGSVFDWGQVEFQEQDLLVGSISRAAHLQDEIGVFSSGEGYGVNVRANPRKNEATTETVHGHGQKIGVLLVEPRGENFISKDRGGILRCWDVDRVLNGWLRSLPISGEAQSVHAIAESDAYLARGGSTDSSGVTGVVGKPETEGVGYLDILSLNNGQTSSRLLGDKVVSGVGFIGGLGNKLLLAINGAEIMLLDLDDPNSVPAPLERPDCPLENRVAEFRHLAVDASGTRVALPTSGGSVHLLEFKAGGTEVVKDTVVIVPGEHALFQKNRLPAVAWHPDGTQLVVAHMTGELSWLRDGKPVSVASFHSEAIRTVAASPDGKWVAAAGEDYLISLWHWGAAEPAYSLVSKHQANIYALAFDEHSRRLASADAAGVALIWDVATWGHGPAQLLYALESKSSIILALHFLRYGNSEQLLMGGDCELGTLTFDPKDLDPFVAGNFTHFASELKGAVSPAAVKKMRRWSQEVLAR